MSERFGFVHLWLIGLVALLLLPLTMLEGNARDLVGETAVDSLVVKFSHPAGVYEQAITLRLTTDHPDAQVLFTTDGSLPLPDSATVYTRPLPLPIDPENVVAIRARAILPDGVMGPVASTSYWMSVAATIPMISLLIDPADLWDPADGIMVNFLEHGHEWERPVTMIYLTENGRFGFQTDAGLRIHGFTSRDQDKKSFRFYFREEYGTAWLQYPIFNDNVDEYKRLVLHAGGQEFPAFLSNGTLLRNRLVANLARQIDGYADQSRPVVVFINGQLWGIYNLRERIDNYFFDSHFGIKPAPGDIENWDHLEQFIRKNDLGDPANYAYLQTQMDVANFIDYSIMQMIIANNDWPYNNIKRFRGHTPGGQWQFIFWDTDYAFGLSPGSHVEVNMVDHILNEQPWFLLSGLLQNPNFHDQFLGRMADLLNTTFAAENVIAEIDALAAELEPNIHYEITRWPGSSNWHSSVEEMREFARRRPDIMRQDMVEGFELAGTAVVTFNPPSSDSGTMIVNGYHLPETPWQGTYFTGTTLRVTAVPHAGYQFVGWQEMAGEATIQLLLDSDQTLTPQFAPVTAGTAPLPDHDVVITPMVVQK